jgi:hypothetical protein
VLEKRKGREIEGNVVRYQCRKNLKLREKKKNEIPLDLKNGKGWFVPVKSKIRRSF